MSDEITKENPQLDIDSDQQVNNLQSTKFIFNNSKKLVVVGMLFVIVLFVIATIFIFLNKSNEQNLQLPITSKPTSSYPYEDTERLLNPPELYPEFEWEEVDQREDYSFTNNFAGNPLYYLDFDPVYASVSGRQWNYSFESTSIDDLRKQKRLFYDYYSPQVEKIGYETEVEYLGKRLQVITADGPTGSIWGVTKIVGNKMRLIMFQDNTITQDAPYSACPCTLIFDVFVSDIFSTTELEH